MTQRFFIINNSEYYLSELSDYHFLGIRIIYRGKPFTLGNLRADRLSLVEGEWNGDRHGTWSIRVTLEIFPNFYSSGAHSETPCRKFLDINIFSIQKRTQGGCERSENGSSEQPDWLWFWWLWRRSIAKKAHETLSYTQGSRAPTVLILYIGAVMLSVNLCRSISLAVLKCLYCKNTAKTLANLATCESTPEQL